MPEGDEESEAAVLMSEMRETATKAAHNALNRALDRTLRLELKDYLTQTPDDAAAASGSGGPIRTTRGVPPRPWYSHPAWIQTAGSRQRRPSTITFLRRRARGPRA